MTKGEFGPGERSAFIAELKAIAQETGDPAERIASALSPFATPARLFLAGETAFKELNYRVSSAAMQRILASQPDDARALTMLARAARRAFDWQAAAQAAETLLANQPKHEEYLDIAAQASVRLADWPRAARHLKSLVRLHPDNADYALRFASALACQDEWAEALQICRSLLSQEPNDETALTLAIRAGIKTELREMQPWWTALARLNPNLVIRWFRLLERQERFEPAAQGVVGLITGCGTTFKFVDERNRFVGRLLMRGQAFLKNKQFALAARAFDAAISIDPELAAAKTGRDQALLGRLPPNSDAAQPADVHRQAQPEPDSQTRIAASARVQSALRSGDLKGAIAGALSLQQMPADRHVVQSVKAVADAALKAARKAFAEKQFADAAELLREAAPLKLSADAVNILARSYWMLKETARSLEQWQLLAEMKPDERAPWLYISRCCKILNRHEEGLRAAKRGLELEPGKTELEDHIALFSRNLAIDSED